MQQYEAYLLMAITDLMRSELHDKVSFLIPSEKVEAEQDSHEDYEITAIMLGHAIMRFLAQNGIVDAPYFLEEDNSDTTR